MRHRKSRSRQIAIAAAASAGLLLLAGTFARPALAQSADDPKTRTLRVHFAEGQLLESAGRWADALDRFEAIARVRRTPQVTFHIALCNEHLGRLRVAERLYLAAAAEAKGTAPVVVAESRNRLADLATRIPSVIVQIDGDTRGVVVHLDQGSVTAGQPVRVDPGPHLAVALRDGRPVAAVAFSVSERRSRFVTLNVFPLPDAKVNATASR